MQINYEPLPQAKIKKSPFSKFLDSFKITQQNAAFATLAIAIGGYVLYTDPLILLTVLFSLALASSLYFIVACLPLVSKAINFKLFFWHVLGVAGALAIVLNPFEPAHALFLTGLETAITTLVGQTDGSVEATQVTLLFTFIRIALILVALGGGFAAWHQQQQGQSMTPIIMFVGGIFGIVLAIDVITSVVM